MSDAIPRAVSRREFLERGALATGALLAGQALPRDTGPSPVLHAQDGGSTRPKVAAVFTEFRFRSHAYNILENFFEPYLFSGELVDPGVEVVSFYADQFPENDMAREVSRRFGIPLFKTIDEALCLGGKRLAVDAVLSIGEHGDYPTNKLGQKMYPRKRFFDEIVAVMKRSRRFVPVFNDKHLSYRWDWAKEMYDISVEHGIPLVAGSSVPLAQRVPPIQWPPDAQIEEAVSIHGGGLESYDFHGLEVLQSFVESRRGGETGISRVELLTGDLLEGAIQEGRFSQSLVEAAMAAEEEKGVKRQKRPDRVARPESSKGVDDRQPRPSLRSGRATPAVSHALLLTYKDGLKAAVLKVGSSANRWNFACRLRGETEPRATALYNGPWGNRCLFKALSHAIQHLFVHRKQPYPVERTLLVTGVLEASMKSHAKWGRPIDTPHLEFAYEPIDFRRFRETGASWNIITEETPQPTGFEPGDRRWLNVDE